MEATKIKDVTLNRVKSQETYRTLYVLLTFIVWPFLNGPWDTQIYFESVHRYNSIMLKSQHSSIVKDWYQTLTWKKWYRLLISTSARFKVKLESLLTIWFCLTSLFLKDDLGLRMHVVEQYILQLRSRLYLSRLLEKTKNVLVTVESLTFKPKNLKPLIWNVSIDVVDVFDNFLSKTFLPSFSKFACAK